MNVLAYPEGKGMNTYVSAVKHLSGNRMNIDFKKLYQKYKSVIHKIVSKDIYQENYAHMVNKLIAAYNDLDGEEEKLENVKELMEKHWGDEGELNYEITMWELYNDLEEKVISPEILKIHEANFNPAESAESNKSFLVWA